MSRPKILTLDIETAPALVYSFNLKPKLISLEQIKEHDRMICFAAKWYGKNKIAFASEYHHGRTEMLHSAFSLLNDADAVVTYNGDRFDLPWLQREFETEGLGQPEPFVSIDLYKVAKKHYKFLSHKLQYVVEMLNTPHLKEDSGGIRTWRAALGDFGDAEQEKAWKRIARYNKADVVTTEDLYTAVRHLTNQQFNHGLFQESTAFICPKCGSESVHKRGFKATEASVYQQYQCQDCGAWSSDRSHRLKAVSLR